MCAGGQKQMTFKEATIHYHNIARAAHNAPPLEWDDELAKFAQKNADQCAEQDTLGHDFTEDDNGEHMGQNAAMCYPDLSEVEIARQSVQMWYDEINDPGYNFEGDFGAGHFTQVVWKESTKVGMAFNGRYVTANYRVGGTMQDAYPENVEAECTGDVSKLYEENKSLADMGNLTVGGLAEMGGDAVGVDVDAEDLGAYGAYEVAQ
jgi:hypothetical protein